MVIEGSCSNTLKKSLEIAHSPSSHIAALKDGGISAATGEQITAAHSDSDLSALNAVTFSKRNFSRPCHDESAFTFRASELCWTFVLLRVNH